MRNIQPEAIYQAAVPFPALAEAAGTGAAPDGFPDHRRINFPSLEAPAPRGGAAAEVASNSLQDLLRAAGAGPHAAARLAGRLLERFGTFRAVLSAPRAAILEEVGAHGRYADLLAAVRGCVGLSLRDPLAERPVFAAWCDVEAYLAFATADDVLSSVRALLLDGSLRLINDPVLAQAGPADEMVVPHGLIVRRALENRAAAVVLVHALPGRPARIVEAHVAAANELGPLLGHLGLSLVDVVVAGADGARSMSAEGLGWWRRSAAP